nr:hypothetical protein CFP56_45473 [Quercus suber]
MIGASILSLQIEVVVLKTKPKIKKLWFFQCADSLTLFEYWATLLIFFSLITVKNQHASPPRDLIKYPKDGVIHYKAMRRRLHLVSVQKDLTPLATQRIIDSLFLCCLELIVVYN